MKKASFLVVYLIGLLLFASYVHAAENIDFDAAHYLVHEDRIQVTFTVDEASELNAEAIQLVMNDIYIEEKDLTITPQGDSDVIEIIFKPTSFTDHNYIDITIDTLQSNFKGVIRFKQPFLPKDTEQPVDILAQADSGNGLLYAVLAIIVVSGAGYIGVKRRSKRKKPREAYVKYLGNDDLYRFKGSFTIGRSRKNDLILTDDSVSAFHAKIKEVNFDYVIEDLESENGIWINRRKITEPKKLVSGDQITIGEQTIEFTYGGGN